jgi:hypothetical protein
MVVVDLDTNRQALMAAVDRRKPLGDGLCLCDGTMAYVGQDVRCVISVKGRIKFGEVYRILRRGARDENVYLHRPQDDAAKATVVLTPEELRRTCRPARMGTLNEQMNSHYAQRTVVVLLSHTHGRAAQNFDPLYTSLALGNHTNVVVVANQSGLTAARSHMQRILDNRPSDVPNIWQDVMRSFLCPQM